MQPDPISARAIWLVFAILVAGLFLASAAERHQARMAPHAEARR